MIEAALVLLVLVVLAIHVWTAREHAAALNIRSANQHEAADDHATALSAALSTERARVSELLRLLEARSAPVEYAAFVHQDTPAAPGTWISSADGLIVHKVDDE